MTSMSAIAHSNLIKAAKKAFVNADTNIMDQTGFFFDNSRNAC